MIAAVFVGCHSGNFSAGRPGFQPEAIVIHIMTGTMAGTRNWFGNPASQVSAHYGVGRDGSIEQYVRETDTAFHAGTVDVPSWQLIKPRVNPNYYTIGIEHGGSGDAPWPEVQMASSHALAADIAQRWGITLDADHVVLHREIRKSKTCPGNFDRDRYLQLGGSPAAAAVVAPPPQITRHHHGTGQCPGRSDNRKRRCPPNPVRDKVGRHRPAYQRTGRRQRQLAPGRGGRP